MSHLFELPLTLVIHVLRILEARLLSLSRMELWLTRHRLHVVTAILAIVISRIQTMVYSRPAWLQSLLFILTSRNSWDWAEVTSRLLSVVVDTGFLFLVNVTGLSPRDSWVTTRRLTLSCLRECLKVFARLTLLIKSPLRASLSVLRRWCTTTQSWRSRVH